MSDLVPPRRASLHLEPLEGGGAVLVDPELGARIRLDPRGAEIVAALDAPQTLEALAQRVAGDPAAVGRVVALFARHHLLATPRAEAHAEAGRALAAVAAAPPEGAALLMREDAAFTCTMCGSCCGGHNVGPVMPDVVAWLAPHLDALGAATGSDKGLLLRMGGPDGAGEQVFCHMRDGSCVFLGDDRRCRIHAAHGGDRKPRVCRLFPWTFTATPAGVAVSISQECRGFAEARHGQPLTARVADARRLLALVPQLEQVRAAVRLTPEQALTWAEYEALEERLHAAVDAHPDDAWAALVAMRDAIAERLDGPAAATGVAPAPAPALATDLDAITDALDALAGSLAETYGESSPQHVVHVETLHELRAVLPRVRPDARRILAPLERVDQRAHFASGLHHRLHGKELALAPTVVVGFARMAFGVLVSRALMVCRARAVKRRHTVLQDLVDATVVVAFLWRNVGFQRALERLDGPLVDLCFERLGALVAAGPTLAEPDRRVDLYKF